MATHSMANIDVRIKEFGAACNRMADGAHRAASALNALTVAHDDLMNAAVSAKVLRAMGHPDLAWFYE